MGTRTIEFCSNFLNWIVDLIQTMDRDEKISYHQSAKQVPFQQINFDGLKYFAITGEKNQVFILHGLGSLLFQSLLGDLWADHLKHMASDNQAESFLFSLDWTPKLRAKLCWPELARLPQLTWKFPLPFKLCKFVISVKDEKKNVFNPFSYSPSQPMPSNRKERPSKSWFHSKWQILNGWLRTACVRF